MDLCLAIRRIQFINHVFVEFNISYKTATIRSLRLHNRESTCCLLSSSTTTRGCAQLFCTSDVRRKPAKRSPFIVYNRSARVLYFRIGIAHKSSNLITFLASQLSYRMLTGQLGRVRSLPHLCLT